MSESIENREVFQQSTLQPSQSLDFESNEQVMKQTLQIKSSTQTPENAKIEQKKSNYKKWLFCIGLLVAIVGCSMLVVVMNDNICLQFMGLSLDEGYELQQLITSNHTDFSLQVKDSYWFAVAISDLIKFSDLSCTYKLGKTHDQITQKKHLRAILLTQLVHNINYQGEIQVQLSVLDKPLSQKKEAIQRLIQLEEKYYEQEYQISKYWQRQLPFCVVVPSYKNAKTMLYKRNLDSIFMQNYTNYKVIYIDDNSPDGTGQFVQQYLRQKNIPEQRVSLILNTERKGALRNIYESIHERCGEDSIVGIIDGDDSLIGKLVFQVFNAMFHKTKAAFIYSNFLSICDNSWSHVGFATDLGTQPEKNPRYIRDSRLLADHFLAFYTSVFKKIKKEDLLDLNGNFFRVGTDKAYLTPLMQMSYPRIYYLRQLAYEYRCNTGQNVHEEEWNKTSDQVRDKQVYSQLQDFSFIDNNPLIMNGQQNVDRLTLILVQYLLTQQVFLQFNLNGEK